MYDEPDMQDLGDILAACRLFEGVSKLPPLDTERTRIARRGECNALDSTPPAAQPLPLHAK